MLPTLAIGQDVGGINLETEASAEGESADANSRNQAQRQSRVNSMIPAGVRQFAQAYPQTHFRFISGDLLSAGFFEVTGLFGFAAGDDPVGDSVDRTFSVERHAGLLSFLTVATAGGHGINAVENRINQRMGRQESSRSITRLKNLAGLNIIAGVYAYVAVDAAFKGKTTDEILDMLQTKETLAAAVSMHLAFMSADLATNHAKEIGRNLKFINALTRNPHALRIASESGLRSGVSLYASALRGAANLNEAREELKKAKLALGVAQPQTIPAIAAQTAVEWTAYYVFAKVWDNLIHERLTRGLVLWDKTCAANNSYSAFDYGMNQQGLIYDETLVASADRIVKNNEQLARLLTSHLVDRQTALLDETAKLDYLFSLYQRYFDAPDKEAKRDLLIELLQKDHPLYDQNLIFFDWLLEAYNGQHSEEFDRKKLLSTFNTIYRIDHPETIRYGYGQLGIAQAMDYQRSLRRDEYEQDLFSRIDTLTNGLSEIPAEEFESTLLSPINTRIAALAEDQEAWNTDMQKAQGMSAEAIEKSYEKYGIDPSIDLSLQDLNLNEKPPRPETVFEVTLLQNIYLNQLKGLTYSETNKEKIESMRAESEMSYFVQASLFEAE